MIITTDMSLRDFNAWSGGRDTMDALTYEQLDTIESNLEDLYPDGMTGTELNDFLWFERETIAEWLGFRSEDAMFEQDDEDWEDHYRTILTDLYDDDFEELIDEWIQYESCENMTDEEVKEQFKDYLEEHAEQEDEEEEEE